MGNSRSLNFPWVSVNIFHLIVNNTKAFTFCNVRTLNVISNTQRAFETTLCLASLQHLQCPKNFSRNPLVMPSMQMRGLSKEKTDGNQISPGQKNTALNTQGPKIQKVQYQKWGSKRTEEQGTLLLLLQIWFRRCVHHAVIILVPKQVNWQDFSLQLDTIRMQTILVDILL